MLNVMKVLFAVLLVVALAAPVMADYYPPPPVCAERLGDAVLVARTMIVPGHWLFSKLICQYTKVPTVNDFASFCGLASLYDPLLNVKVKATRVKCVFRVLPRYLVP